MGQAKRRGSFEERKAQSIARSRAEAEKRYAEYQSRERGPLASMGLHRRRSRMPLLLAATLAASAWQTGHRGDPTPIG